MEYYLEIDEIKEVGEVDFKNDEVKDEVEEVVIDIAPIDDEYKSDDEEDEDDVYTYRINTFLLLEMTMNQHLEPF